jgi:hypothetical protein
MHAFFIALQIIRRQLQTKMGRDKTLMQERDKIVCIEGSSDGGDPG